jgi:hypothetical protein
MESFFLLCVATGVSLLAVWCLIGATPWGSRGHWQCRSRLDATGCARRMVVLSTFREPSLCRQAHRELLRSVLLDVTPVIAATACHQRNYIADTVGL